MKVLLVGSGGREHALAWKLSQSPSLDKLFIAPGNGGTASLGENVEIAATSISQLVNFAKQNQVELTIVGPDDPLAAGIVDSFQEAGLKAFGPTKKAAQIEASKAFSKQLMQKNGIPTAKFETFGDYNQALEYLRQQPLPIVVKASGLALGKGVAVCKTLAEAEVFLSKLMKDKIFGAAGATVVVEEYLEGQEISIHAFSDGKTFKLMPTAQDHKPVNDDDKGPNTGGMGTYAPVPWVKKELMAMVEATVVEPALQSLRPYVGCLYPGLKITSEGPKVLEFNARFGDPETQSYVRLLDSDLLDITQACADGKLAEISIKWSQKFAACIVLASGGYPGEYKKGLPISGIAEAEKDPDVIVFHAGTKLDGDKFVTNGGRVLNVTATGTDLKTALVKAYAAVKKIHFEGVHYRTDIGAKAL